MIAEKEIPGLMGSLQDKYVLVDRSAEGGYGVVFKAKNKKTQQFVAIKTFKNVSDQGLPTSAIRQINCLKSIQSPYILKPIQILTYPNSIHLVMEWKELTLTKLILSKEQIDCQKVMRQLLKAVKSMHDQNYMHRDLKPSNIVLENGTENIGLYLIDFGTAKPFTWKKNAKLTNGVGTLHFRAPELLEGATHYDFSVDMWALGCIFYQILTRQILFKTQNDKDQLIKIYEEIATQQQAQLLIQNKKYNIQTIKLKNWQGIQEKIKQIPDLNPTLIIDFLKRLIRINPKQRISCEQALNHPCFATS